MKYKKDKTTLDLVVPCFNEEEGVSSLVATCISASQNFPVTFIFVDNGSTDRTNEFLVKLCPSEFTVLSIANNLGYGDGINRGLNLCSSEYVGWFHADLQVDLLEFLEDLFSNGLDPNTFYKGRRKGRSLLANILTEMMSTTMTVLFRRKLVDINGQPTIFPRILLKDFRNPPINFTFDLYVFLIAIFKDLRIKRIEVVIRDRTTGISSWNRGLLSVVKLSITIFKGGILIKKSLRK